jgi:pimeloyl-ACP methyl ester carboxylesterase
VLVHGFWVTPRSWEHWIPHYEAKGYRVLAPAYPGFEVEVEALNADPTPVERLTVPAVIAHLESIVATLDAPPILMGHSAGGTFVQILLDRGFALQGDVQLRADRGRPRRCRSRVGRCSGAQEPAAGTE